MAVEVLGAFSNVGTLARGDDMTVKLGSFSTFVNESTGQINGTGTLDTRGIDYTNDGTIQQSVTVLE